MDGAATDQGHDSSEYDNHGEEDRHVREDFYEGLLHSGSSFLQRLVGRSGTPSGPALGWSSREDELAVARLPVSPVSLNRSQNRKNAEESAHRSIDVLSPIGCPEEGPSAGPRATSRRAPPGASGPPRSRSGAHAVTSRRSHSQPPSFASDRRREARLVGGGGDGRMSGARIQSQLE